MSSHCYSGWKIEDPIESAPIAQIASAVKDHGYTVPRCFGTFSHGDRFILLIGVFLSHSRGEVLTRGVIHKFVEALEPEEHADKIEEVIVRVLESLSLLNSVLPIIESAKIEIPSQTSAGKIVTGE